jgi:lactoylglutathione lyase
MIVRSCCTITANQSKESNVSVKVRKAAAMKLNHVALAVTDVTATVAFLETYFGLRRAGQRGKNFAALFDDDGLVLTLMKAAKGSEVAYPSHFHIGFSQESEERVNAINQRLKEDGFAVEAPRRAHAWTFSVLAPGGFLIEVAA